MILYVWIFTFDHLGPGQLWRYISLILPFFNYVLISVIMTVVIIKMVKTVKMMSMVHAMKRKFVAKLSSKKHIGSISYLWGYLPPGYIARS